MSDYLMECGYEVFEAGDGQEALDLFHRETPDLVLLDIQLPILNGLEVLKTIRKTSSVPVLMLTAFHDEDYKLTAFGELADGYLEKPFSLSLLKVRIEAIFKKLQPSFLDWFTTSVRRSFKWICLVLSMYFLRTFTGSIPAKEQCPLSNSR